MIAKWWDDECCSSLVAARYHDEQTGVFLPVYMKDWMATDNFPEVFS